MLKLPPITRPAFVFGILAFLGLVVYGHTFHYEFCSDDMMFIVDNNFVKHLDAIGVIWSNFNTRFIGGLSFALNYHFGKLDPFGYHVVNLIIHILNAFLVYVFARVTFLTPNMQNARLKNEPLFALWAALIFLLHPVQTESVAYISQRITSLATFFYLGTVILYIKARLESKEIYLLGAALSMLVAIFSKEMTITIPFALVVYELFFFPQDKAAWRVRVKGLLPFFLLGGLLLAVFNMDHANSLLQLKEQVSKGFQWNYFFTEINVLRTYLRLLVLPLYQNHSYEYPITQDFLNVPTIFSLNLLIILFCLALWQIPKRRMMSYAMVWFFMATSVEAGQVCFVHLGVIYEHWLYLPMVGFALFLPAVFYSFIKDERKILALMAVILIVLGVLTFQRSRVWQSELTLFGDVVKKSPGSFIGYNHISTYLFSQKKWEPSIAASIKSLECCKAAAVCLPQQRSKILVTLSGAFFEIGDYRNSMMFAVLGVEADPGNFKAYNNIGAIYYKLGNFQEAIKYMEAVTTLAPNYTLAYINLGIIYRQKNDIGEAMNYFKQALMIDPDDTAAIREVNYTLEQISRVEKERGPLATPPSCPRCQEAREKGLDQQGSEDPGK